MSYSKLFVVGALVASIGALRVHSHDDSDKLGRNVDKTTWEDMKISGFNGADEDEIMDNIFSRFSKEG